MTNKTQMNRIEKQLLLYKKFLKVCDINSIAKLCVEIVKLENRLQILRTMTDNQIMDQVIFQDIIIQSKANKLNL
jgi:hypothetical protein